MENEDEIPTNNVDSKKCKNCGGKLETKVAAVSYDGKYQITQVECDKCSVQEWHVDERPGAPSEIDAIV